MGNIIDHRILAQSRGPDIGATFRNILTNVEGFDRINQNRANAPLQNQLLQQGVNKGEQQAAQNRARQGLESIAIFGAEVSPMLEVGDVEGAKQATRRRIQKLQQQGIPTDESMQFLQLLDSDPQLAQQRAAQAAQLGQKLGIFQGQQRASPSQKGQARTIKRNGKLFSQQEIFNPNTGTIEVVETPIEGDLVQRSTGRTTGESVDFAGEVEGIKLVKKLKFAPQIARDVAKAKQEVSQRGLVFTELNQAEAALPGLKDVVSKLKMLSSEATFTLGGRVFDETAKQLFGVATKGATSRDKMTSLISNQVLPLLKPIFGSQFTEREGDRLIAAFADVNSTPESRRGQLDSFLSQMERNIDAKRLELEGIEADNQATSSQPTATATGPNGERIGLVNGQWVPIDG